VKIHFNPCTRHVISSTIREKHTQRQFEKAESMRLIGKHIDLSKHDDNIGMDRKEKAVNA
jgi:hypothetical protein